jgi:hypothetical protein
MGPGVSEVREAGNVSEETGVGRGLIVGLGRIVAPGLFLVFFFFSSFLLFLFSISFISFAKLLQINSNHFQKNSKNQCNDLTLQEN